MIVFNLIFSLSCFALLCEFSTKSEAQMVIPNDMIAYQFNQRNIVNKNNGIIIVLQRPSLNTSSGLSFCLRVNVWTLGVIFINI